MPHRTLRSVSLLVAAMLIPCTASPAEYVEFSFALEPTAQAPLAREVFAEVEHPNGLNMRLPAFFESDTVWTIRVRPSQAGEYKLTRVMTVNDVGMALLPAEPRSPDFVVRTTCSARKAVRRHPGDATALALTDGTIFTPIGANLAWTAGERVSWHLDAFRQFAANDLNWTRIWMCHWGAMNLDWLPEDMGRSPRPGLLDARIAQNWDRILDAAEEHGIYVQLVLQHHGQYTTGANANWALNPWNAANKDGFLRTPGEFFTSPQAIALTKQKYRYIVARWGYSPAIMAWELFNEVHWTNAYRDDGNEAAVAAWHAEMAAYIRSIDPYDHLITTSLEDLRSPIYAAMDYYQPHLYAINMLTGAREFERPVAELDRPVFYGEIGDDKMLVSDAEKAAGSQLIPQIWASLMGPRPIPAQSWLGEVFIRTHRVGELGAIARFLRETQLATRPGLAPFSPAVASMDTLPLQVIPGYDWATHRPGEITLPLDGSDSLATNHVPGILVGAPKSVAEGYLPEFTVYVDMPRDTTATIAFSDGGARGASVAILVDGIEVGAHRWPELPDSPGDGAHPTLVPRRPAALAFPLTRGRHAITIRNTGGVDWIRIGHIDLGLDTPIIAAAGKRGTDFITLWAWNKRDVHALTPSGAPTATLLIADVPAGPWTVTWWDADRGVPATPSTIEHPGGTLHLATPPIARHAAVVLTR